jgi:hypothetical protein
MSLDFSEIYISLVSNIIGIDLKQIKRVLDKEKLRKSGQVEISDSIDVVSKKLEESKNIIDNALLEMEKQKKLFVQMKKDADRLIMRYADSSLHEKRQQLLLRKNLDEGTGISNGI